MFVVGGESLIDLVSEPRGADGTIRMQAHQGGSPYNCAIALSKLGNDTGYLCPISTDAFGDYLLEPLAEAGVKQLLKDRVEEPTTLAVVTLDARGKAEYAFHRQSDRAFTRDTLMAALPDAPVLFQTGGFCPIEPVDAAIWLDVLAEAVRRGATISLDPNWRQMLITDREGYISRLDHFFDIAHLIKVSDEDLAHLDDSKSIETHAGELLGRPNCELVVVTLGERGSRAFTKFASADAPIWSPPVFGDTVGAGDSLMAGILTILNERGHLKPGRMSSLDGNALAEVLRFGAVVAGLNCGHKGCNPPTRAEVEAVLAQA